MGRKRGRRSRSPICDISTHFPRNLGDILLKYDKVLVPELNGGQLAHLLDAKFPLKVISYPKVKGQPFKISEITGKINELLGK